MVPLCGREINNNYYLSMLVSQVCVCVCVCVRACVRVCVCSVHNLTSMKGEKEQGQNTTTNVCEQASFNLHFPHALLSSRCRTGGGVTNVFI